MADRIASVRVADIVEAQGADTGEHATRSCAVRDGNGASEAASWRQTDRATAFHSLPPTGLNPRQIGTRPQTGGRTEHESVPPSCPPWITPRRERAADTTKVKGNSSSFARAAHRRRIDEAGAGAHNEWSRRSRKSEGDGVHGQQLANERQPIPRGEDEGKGTLMWRTGMEGLEMGRELESMVGAKRVRQRLPAQLFFNPQDRQDVVETLGAGNHTNRVVQEVERERTESSSTLDAMRTSRTTAGVLSTIFDQISAGLTGFFLELDSDSNGHIDAKELLEGLLQLQTGLTSLQLLDFVTSCIGRDGFITLASMWSAINCPDLSGRCKPSSSFRDKGLSSSLGHRGSHEHASHGSYCALMPNLVQHQVRIHMNVKTAQSAPLLYLLHQCADAADRVVSLMWRS